MKNLTDFDLDVMNALKEFPVNEVDGFIFIRGVLESGHIRPGFIHSKSSSDMFSAMIYSLMSLSEDHKRATFNAVLNLLKQSKPAEREEFIEMVKQLI